jgi:hypothetical protein
MLDVIKLLNAPLPWESHGSALPLPNRYQALMSDGAAKAKSFFVASGPVAPAFGLARTAVPGINPQLVEVPAKLRLLHAVDLAEIQSAVDEAIATARPQRLVVTGSILWNGSLQIDGADTLILDFANLRIDVHVWDEPLVSVTRSRKIAVRGMRITQAHAIAMDVSGSEDVTVTAAVVAGSHDATIRISGGTRCVLIDRCTFMRNSGVAVRVVGEVDRVVILQSTFDGPTRSCFIHLVAAQAARGYSALQSDEPGRDALIRLYPTSIHILENRFGRTDAVAIVADGTRGVWVERNDFNGPLGGAFVSINHAAGVMLADNRVAPIAKTLAPLVAIRDTAFFCIFRNTFEPVSQECVRVSGAFGGGLIAANSLLNPKPENRLSAEGTPGKDPYPTSGIVLDPGPTAEEGAFMSTTLMLNSVRGAFNVGFDFQGPVPRIFMFDNHIYGVTEWSFKSEVAQTMVTSMNNWSPVKSLNLQLSDMMIDVGRMVWTANAI